MKNKFIYFFNLNVSGFEQEHEKKSQIFRYSSSVIRIKY